MLSNAFRYTREEFIEFGYSLERERIIFFVKDSGIGIDSKNYDNIFDRFNRVTDNSEVLYGGTGLGLSICKGYAHYLNGNIWFESELGIGSTFYFAIPYVAIENIRPILSDIEKDPCNFDGQTILVVEDEDLNFKYFEEILSQLQVNFIRAKTGTEALDLLSKDQRIDLILMDIRLPEMNGYDVTREIRKMNNRVPVIAQTAYALIGDWEKALEAGCNDYISKPIIEKQLIELLKTYLFVDS